MALISSIRSRSWILIVFIGVGLASFILMDMFGSNTSAFGNRPTNTLGMIDGQEIDYNKVRRTEEVFYRGATGSTYGVKDQIWNYYLEKALLEKQGDKLGLNVGKEELNDLVFGNNLSPVVQAVFRNPQTGQVDMASLNDIKAKLASGSTEINTPYMEELVGQVKKARLQEKFTSLVSQGMYTPNWMAESVGKENSTTFDFKYVKVPFSDVDNSQVSVSDADLTNYLNNNKAIYNNEEETRQIEYVSFEVFPSKEDSTTYYNQLNTLKPNFRSAINDSTFVAANGGSLASTYVKKSTLSPEIADRMMSSPVGTVVGPYMEAGTYKLAKVSARKVIADSVKVQHILVRANPSDPNSFAAAITRIDSVRTAFDNGESFGNLAAQVSEDTGSSDANGELGYLGYNNNFGPSFSNPIFYESEKGSVKTVFTQFGVHLVKVNDLKYLSQDPSVKVAYLTRSIIPSDKTQKSIREKVQEFVNEHTTKQQLEELAASDPALSIQTTANLKRNDYIVSSLGQDPSSREMVRWAFDEETNIGDLSPDFYVYRYSNPQTYVNYDSKYVVAALASVQKPGMPSLASIRSQIEPLVLNQKKADFVSSAINGKDLASVAAQYNTSVDQLDGISASSTNVRQIGNEPKVVAALMNMSTDQVSAPIKGENGVYVLQLLNKSQNANADLAGTKRLQSTRVKSLARTALMDAMKKDAEITDNRFNVY
jgi:peptidyl-prolyl cis-trans isomerase D